VETLRTGQFKTSQGSGKGCHTNRCRILVRARRESQCKEKLEFKWVLKFSSRQAVWSLATSAELGHWYRREQQAPAWECGTHSTLPSLSQFGNLRGWEGGAVRNCGLFLIRDYIWQSFQFRL